MCISFFKRLFGFNNAIHPSYSPSLTHNLCTESVIQDDEETISDTHCNNWYYQRDLKYFFFTAKNGNLNELEKVLPNINIDSVDLNGNSALHLAAQGHHTNICNYLIAKGANLAILNDEGFTAIELLLMTTIKENITKLYPGYDPNTIFNNENCDEDSSIMTTIEYHTKTTPDTSSVFDSTQYC